MNSDNQAITEARVEEELRDRDNRVDEKFTTLEKKFTALIKNTDRGKNLPSQGATMKIAIDTFATTMVKNQKLNDEKVSSLARQFFKRNESEAKKYKQFINEQMQVAIAQMKIKQWSTIVQQVNASDDKRAALPAVAESSSVVAVEQLNQLIHDIQTQSDEQLKKGEDQLTVAIGQMEEALKEQKKIHDEQLQKSREEVEELKNLVGDQKKAHEEQLKQSERFNNLFEHMQQVIAGRVQTP